MRQQILKFYYLTTPLFWMIDLIWGVNIRASGFDTYPVLKHIYYTTCLGCAAAIWKWPTYGEIIGLSESFVNILSIILGFLGPYYAMLGAVSQDIFDTPNPMTHQHIINFLISATAACISFHSQVPSSTRKINVLR